MQANPETIHWDMVMNYCNMDGSAMWIQDCSNEEPVDAQFMTHRVSMWKTILNEEYPAAKCIHIMYGEQIKIEDHITITLYDSGKVMVQGPDFKTWAENDFIHLKKD